MNNLILPQNETMSHSQIATLVKSRNDSVKRTIERLTKEGLITFTPTVETNSQNKEVVIYHVNERDSYVVVAQLSPQFTAFLVDEWQKKKAPKPITQEDQLLMLAQGVIRLTAERDFAIKNKAQVNDKRTATIMGKLGNATKKINKLEAQLQNVGVHVSITGAKVPDRVDTEFKSNVQTWRVLKQISEEMKCEILKVKDARYGEVNTYHVDVIERFKELYL